MHVVYDVCCGKQETNKSRFYIGQPFCCVCVCVMGAGVDVSCPCSQRLCGLGGRLCKILPDARLSIGKGGRFPGHIC